MRKISRATDSIWHTSALDDFADAQYQMHKVVSDAHRADAAKLSDHDLQEGYDDLADDLELDKHNKYDWFGHFFNSPNVGEMPERTHAEQAHDDLERRHQAFGDELDARGLWGPKLENYRQKFRERVEGWGKTRQHQQNMIDQGWLTPDHEAYYTNDEAGMDKYMANGGFHIADVKSMTSKYQEHLARRNKRKMTQLFGPGGFDPNNMEHHNIKDQLLMEYKEKEL